MFIKLLPYQSCRRFGQGHFGLSAVDVLSHGLDQPLPIDGHLAGGQAVDAAATAAHQ